MTNEVFKLMKCFPGSYINACGELILSKKGNVYFTAHTCLVKENIICKLLEWVSRPLAKGEVYRKDKKNNEWRDNLIACLNKYLGTDFDQTDMYWIYDKLGNGVDHELTLEFIKSGFDLSLVYPKGDSQ